MPNKCNTPSKQAPGKGITLREQNHPTNADSFMNQKYGLKRFRSFQRDIMGLCRSKGC